MFIFFKTWLLSISVWLDKVLVKLKSLAITFVSTDIIFLWYFLAHLCVVLPADTDFCEPVLFPGASVSQCAAKLFMVLHGNIANNTTCTVFKFTA